MIMLGTLINTGAIIAGGVVGSFFQRGLKERFQETLMSAMGLSVILLSIGGVCSEMLTLQNGQLETQGVLMMIVSLALGALVGEAINLEHHTQTFGAFLREKSGNSGDNKFVDAFVTASLTVCIGAMAIVGSIQDGLTGDISVLVTKAILDCIIIFVMTASMGKGCIFSAIPVFLLQGIVTLLAATIAPFITQAALDNISLVGDGLILCVGINTMFHQKIKVANLLPALIFAAVWAYLPF